MTNEGIKQAARRQKRIGVVSSAKGDKTIRVVVSQIVRHSQYGKYVRRQTKLAAHDAKNEAKVGDQVEVVACRRMSKTKNWRLLRIVRQGVATEPVMGGGQ